MCQFLPRRVAVIRTRYTARATFKTRNTVGPLSEPWQIDPASPPPAPDGTGDSCYWFFRLVSTFWLFLFLGAFAKLWKRLCFVTSVRPSVRMEQRGSNWTDFRKIWYLSILKKKKTVEKIQVSLKSDKSKGYFTWRPIHIFFIITRSILLWMINISDKIAEQIKTHILHSITSPPPRKSCRLRDNVGKCCRAEHATDDNMAQAHCRLDT